MNNQSEKIMDAARGFISLGMHQDAWNELESLPPEESALDGVLEMRIGIYEGMGKWESARMLAESLTKRSPENPGWWIHLASVTRHGRSVEEARGVMLDAFRIHPGVAAVAYNLGCYNCLLGDLDIACSLLQHAFGLDNHFKKLALEDPDLVRIYGMNLPDSPPSLEL